MLGKHLVRKRMDGGVITGAESKPSSAVHSVPGGDAHTLSRTGHSMLLGISGKRVYSLNAALRTSQSRRPHLGEGSWPLEPGALVLLPRSKGTSGKSVFSLC